jgi:hypothetical protein
MIARLHQVQAGMNSAPPAPTIVDEYFDDENSSATLASSTNAASQSFTGNGKTLDSVELRLRKNGSPTGTVTVSIYAITGTHGTNAQPTGFALATAVTMDASALDGSYDWVKFNFTGANRITLTNGTNYALRIDYGTGDTSNDVRWSIDATSPTHSGNIWNNRTGASNAGDHNFKVWGV